MNTTCRPRRRALAIVLASSVAWSCSSTGSGGFVPREAGAVLPAGGGSYLLFDETGISQRRGSETLWAKSYGTGAPSAAGFDLEGGWACVGYANQLAMLQLGDTEPRWVPSPEPGLYRSIGVRDDLAALTVGGNVHVVEIPGGEVVSRLAAGQWVAARGQETVDYALPLSRDEVVLLSSEEEGGFKEGTVMAFRMDRSQGTWRQTQDARFPAMHWVERAVSAGNELYVAGLWEEMIPRAGSGVGLGSFEQTLIVVRLGLDSFLNEVLVQERVETGTKVLDVSVGTDALAVLFASGEVRVFDLTSRARLRREHFPGAESIAWAAEGDLVILVEGVPKIVRYGG